MFVVLEDTPSSSQNSAPAPVPPTVHGIPSSFRPQGQQLDAIEYKLLTALDMVTAGQERVESWKRATQRLLPLFEAQAEDKGKGKGKENTEAENAGQSWNWNWNWSTPFTVPEIQRLSRLLRLDEVQYSCRISVPADMAFCVLAARLAFPSRWIALCHVFGRSKTWLSTAFNDILDFLIDEWGHKRQHGLQFQVVVTPDGVVSSLMSSWLGPANNWQMWHDSRIEHRLEALMDNNPLLYLYGDPAYHIRYRIMAPVEDLGGRGRQFLEAEERHFNARLASIRIAFENAFGQTQQLWIYTAFAKGLQQGS